MKLIINGVAEVAGSGSAGLNISRLLIDQKVENADMVSVQLNGEFVDREAYGSTLVNDGDSIDFLYFMGGGA